MVKASNGNPGLLPIASALGCSILFPFTPNRPLAGLVQGCSENLIPVYAASGVLRFSNVFAFLL